MPFGASFGSRGAGVASHVPQLGARVDRPGGHVHRGGHLQALCKAFEALGRLFFRCFGSKSGARKPFRRLNEAIFNLPEEDNLDEDTTGLLFKAVCFMGPL